MVGVHGKERPGGWWGCMARKGQVEWQGCMEREGQVDGGGAWQGRVR